MKKNDKGVIITEQQGYGSSVISQNMSVAKDEQRFRIIQIEAILGFFFVMPGCNVFFYYFKMLITLQDVKE